MPKKENTTEGSVHLGSILASSGFKKARSPKKLPYNLWLENSYVDSKGIRQPNPGLDMNKLLKDNGYVEYMELDEVTKEFKVSSR